jgi:hypothetical protein
MHINCPYGPASPWDKYIDKFGNILDVCEAHCDHMLIYEPKWPFDVTASLASIV